MNILNRKRSFAKTLTLASLHHASSVFPSGEDLAALL